MAVVLAVAGVIWIGHGYVDDYVYDHQLLFRVGARIDRGKVCSVLCGGFFHSAS